MKDIIIKKVFCVLKKRGIIEDEDMDMIDEIVSLTISMIIASLESRDK